MFYRHRAAVDEEPLERARAPDGDVPRRSARRHEVRARLAVRARRSRAATRRSRGARLPIGLSVPAEAVDVRPAAELREPGAAAARRAGRARGAGGRPAARAAGGVRRDHAERQPLDPAVLQRAARRRSRWRSSRSARWRSRRFNVSELVALVASGAATCTSQDRARRRRDAPDPGEAESLQQHRRSGTTLEVARGLRRAKPTTLIDQRTFSWTVFFGLIEKTLPLDVRLVAVSPSVEKGVFKVTMIVVAKTRRRSLDVRRRAPGGTARSTTCCRARSSRTTTARSARRSSRAYDPPNPRRSRRSRRRRRGRGGRELWRRIYEERRRSRCRCWCSCWPTRRCSRSRCCRCAGAWRATKREALDATVKLGQARLENKRADDARVSKEEADKELKKFYADVLPTDCASSRAARDCSGSSTPRANRAWCFNRARPISRTCATAVCSASRVI